MTAGDRRPDSDAESTSKRDSSGDETDQQQPDDPSSESKTSPTALDKNDDTSSDDATNATEAPESDPSSTSAPSTDPKPVTETGPSTDESQPSTESAEPIESTEPIESAEPIEAAQPLESTEPAGPTKPLWRRFLTANDGPLLLLREICISLTIVLVLGGLLFGISGVWPPMVAVESESMEPNINKYDLIFVTEPGRFSPSQADQLGVVTAGAVDESEYASFNAAGSVVVFDNPSSSGPPIIHRAHFFVEEGENWHDRANSDYISASNCDGLQYCPAPHDGYITKGDNDASNSQYDQANGIAPVVRSEWVTGVARLRLPYAGYIRLALTGAASSGPLLPVGLGAIGASGAYAIGRRKVLQS